MSCWVFYEQSVIFFFFSCMPYVLQDTFPGVFTLHLFFFPFELFAPFAIHRLNKSTGCNLTRQARGFPPVSLWERCWVREGCLLFRCSWSITISPNPQERIKVRPLACRSHIFQPTQNQPAVLLLILKVPFCQSKGCFKVPLQSSLDLFFKGFPVGHLIMIMPFQPNQDIVRNSPLGCEQNPWHRATPPLSCHP